MSSAQEALQALDKAISIGRFPIVSDRDTILGLVVEARDALLKETVETKTILREYLGGTESVSFVEFAGDIVQDDDAALEIAEKLLDLRSGAGYFYNEDQEPEYIERFTVLDARTLRTQVEAHKKEVM